MLKTSKDKVDYNNIKNRLNELIEKDKHLKNNLMKKTYARSSSRNTNDMMHYTNTILINNLKTTKLPFETEKKIKEDKSSIVKTIIDSKITIQFNSIANIKKMSHSLSKIKNLISYKKNN